MRSLIANYVNGNLSDAKAQARHFSQAAIECSLMAKGYSHLKAFLTARWLKTGEGWQEACDAK